MRTMRDRHGEGLVVDELSVEGGVEVVSSCHIDGKVKLILAHTILFQNRGDFEDRWL